MKLHQLELLLAVATHGGIRAAARELHLSQAAVTKAMRTLEGEAGLPLLQRTARGVVATPAGERLLARARVVSRQVALAREELAQAAGEDFGSVRVGVTPALTLTGLGPAFHWFRRRYRRVQVQLIEGLMARVMPRLRDGSLDLAAVAVDAGELPDEEAVHVQRLRTDAQCVVVREGHPVLAEPSPAVLVAQEWVTTAPLRPGHQPHLDAMFAQAGVAPPTRAVVCDTLAALTVLRHSDAVAVMPRPLLGHPETRGLVALPDGVLQPPPVDLLLLTPRDLPLTPAADYFRHCLAQETAVSTSPGAAAPRA